VNRKGSKHYESNILEYLTIGSVEIFVVALQDLNINSDDKL